jgi:hypothetical protein
MRSSFSAGMNQGAVSSHRLAQQGTRPRGDMRHSSVRAAAERVTRLAKALANLTIDRRQTDVAAIYASLRLTEGDVPVVLSVATPDYISRWNFCIDSQRAYCRSLGYEYRVIDPSQSALHPKWAKLEIAAHFLEAGRDVLLIDADAEIDPSCPGFSELFARSLLHDILFVNGVSGRPNSGVLALRGGRSSVAAPFLRECLASRKETVPAEDFVTAEGENGHVIWKLKEQRFADRSGELPRVWNCSDPAIANQAYVRHYTNHLREWLEHRR